MILILIIIDLIYWKLKRMLLLIDFIEKDLEILFKKFENFNLGNIYN